MEPTPTHRNEIRKLLDKVLVEAAIALPLNKALELPLSAKQDLEIVIRDLFLPKDAERAAKTWEPNRKLDASLKASLREDLIDLLLGRRAPYAGLPKLDLETAQAHPERYSHLIRQILPTADAKKLLKAWDKKLKPVPTTRDQIVKRLVDLLESRARSAAA